MSDHHDDKSNEKLMDLLLLNNFENEIVTHTNVAHTEIHVCLGTIKNKVEHLTLNYCKFFYVFLGGRIIE